jgi:hypothetical protein
MEHRCGCSITFHFGSPGPITRVLHLSKKAVRGGNDGGSSETIRASIIRGGRAGFWSKFPAKAGVRKIAIFQLLIGRHLGRIFMLLLTWPNGHRYKIGAQCRTWLGWGLRGRRRLFGARRGHLDVSAGKPLRVEGFHRCAAVLL